MARALQIGIVVLVATGCAGRDWRRAQELNTGEAYRSFVTANPRSGRVDEALRRADQLDWIAARAADTPEAYAAYLGAHPDGLFASRARTEAEALAFAEAEREDSPEALMAFLVQFPQTERRAEVEDRIESAWHQLALREDTEDAWGRYLVRYPDGRWAADARAARDEAAWARTVEGDTQADYERYLDRFDNGSYRLDALDWLERLKVKRLQPIVALGEAPVAREDRAALAYEIRKEVDRTLVRDLRRDFEILRTKMVDLRGAPPPHPQDAYGASPDTGLLVVVYNEKRGRPLQPTGRATDIDADVELYSPPSRKPVLATEVKASTALPVRGTSEAVLHDSAVVQFGERLRALVDAVARFREDAE